MMGSVDRVSRDMHSLTWNELVPAALGCIMFNLCFSRDINDNIVPRIAPCLSLDDGDFINQSIDR